jgi:hypothetical protein
VGRNDDGPTSPRIRLPPGRRRSARQPRGRAWPRRGRPGSTGSSPMTAGTSPLLPPVTTGPTVDAPCPRDHLQWADSRRSVSARPGRRRPALSQHRSLHRPPCGAHRARVGGQARATTRWTPSAGSGSVARPSKGRAGSDHAGPDLRLRELPKQRPVSGLTVPPLTLRHPTVPLLRVPLPGRPHPAGRPPCVPRAGACAVVSAPAGRSPVQHAPSGVSRALQRVRSPPGTTAPPGSTGRRRGGGGLPDPR